MPILMLFHMITLYKQFKVIFGHIECIYSEMTVLTNAPISQLLHRIPVPDTMEMMGESPIEVSKEWRDVQFCLR